MADPTGISRRKAYIRIRLPAIKAELSQLKAERKGFPKSIAGMEAGARKSLSQRRAYVLERTKALTVEFDELRKEMNKINP